LNALVASQKMIVPLQCEFYALEGLSHLLQTLQRVKKHFGLNLMLQGVILTMYDKRSLLNQQVAEDARKHLGKKVYETVIPRNIRISEAASFGKPVLLYDMKCVGAQAYIQLAKEFLHKQGE
jgi:chromosome partitioning protein